MKSALREIDEDVTAASRREVQGISDRLVEADVVLSDELDDRERARGIRQVDAMRRVELGIGW